MKLSLMKENQLSLVGKALASAVAVVLAVSALRNVWSGEAARPSLFVIAICGFVLFAAAKLSVIARRRWISFGTAQMRPAMANAYRAGYWLMAVGVLATFA